MIKFIIEQCLKNRYLVLIIFSSLMVFGWNAMKHVPVDAIPDIGEQQVIVYAEWPGRSPQDM
ncbi:MAG: efflux RND transporter permease subunit, partial [Candidatus Omnitrophica bacterium]|nr:efflux RND transporter permease subunit [Candidatus Omnitrophota bacterium]